MVRMKVWHRFWILPLSFAALTAHAQTISESTTALRDALLKQQRYLRGFSADTEIHWTWKDGALIQTEPKVHIFSAVVPSSVKVKGSKVEITAERYAIFRNKNAKLALVKLDETARITVDLTGADVMAVLPHLADSLFYRNLDEALSALPPVYKDSVPPYLDPKDKPKTAPAECDCAEAVAKKCGSFDIFMSSVGAKLPKLIRSAEPVFSEAARKKKFNGNVQTGLVVDETGTVSDVWIVRPAALGLDEAATDAVKQYYFSPATCHGQPVATHLYIDVNFQIF